MFIGSGIRPVMLQKNFIILKKFQNIFITFSFIILIYFNVIIVTLNQLSFYEFIEYAGRDQFVAFVVWVPEVPVHATVPGEHAADVNHV